MSSDLLESLAPDLSSALTSQEREAFLSALVGARTSALPEERRVRHRRSYDSPAELRPYPGSAPSLICTIGEPRHGKDLVIDYVSSQFSGVRREAFSRPIIREANELFLRGSGRAIDESNKSYLPYRRLLQELGVARRSQDPSYWVGQLSQQIQSLRDDPETSVVLVSGARALGDFEMIEQLGGELWRVIRPALLGADDADHRIEFEGMRALASSRVSLTILNDREGDLSRVSEQVELALKRSSND